MEINFYGGIFGQSGYDSHTRQILNSLYKLNPHIFLDCPKPHDWIRFVNTNEMNMINNNKYINGMDISITLPPYWQYLLSESKKFAGWVVWEGSNVPFFWKEILNNEKVKSVIVPSNHVKNAILNTFDCNKITIIPHGINNKLFVPNPIKHPKFRFIANKGWAKGLNDRGGIQWLLKAFTEEFKRDDDVELLLKINTAYCEKGWDLANELRKLGLTPESTKNIKFILENTDYNNLPKLYNEGDVFVSPTMGDGFNIPCLEAMACGLPVITTNFGGQIDYVNNTNGWLINYDLVDAQEDIMYEGDKWAQVKIEHLKQLMRYCLQNKDEVKKKGNIAYSCAQKYTWDNSAKMLLNLIKEEY